MLENLDLGATNFTISQGLYSHDWADMRFGNTNEVLRLVTGTLLGAAVSSCNGRCRPVKELDHKHEHGVLHIIMTPRLGWFLKAGICGCLTEVSSVLHEAFANISGFSNYRERLEV